MIRTCDVPHCGLRYDDAYNYTSCPHMPIGAGPAPFHPTSNPGGYCKEHDLFACKMPKHAAFRLYDNWRDGFMPAEKEVQPFKGLPFQTSLAEAAKAVRVLDVFINGRIGASQPQVTEQGQRGKLYRPFRSNHPHFSDEQVQRLLRQALNRLRIVKEAIGDDAVLKEIVADVLAEKV